MKTVEQIYIYDWNNNNIKKVRNGITVTNQMELCRICYKELIEKTKSEIKKTIGNPR